MQQQGALPVPLPAACHHPIKRSTRVLAAIHESQLGSSSGSCNATACKWSAVHAGIHSSAMTYCPWVLQVTLDFKLALPQVAVVGSQSSGKSSVLEALVRGKRGHSSTVGSSVAAACCSWQTASVWIRSSTASHSTSTDVLLVLLL